MKELWSEKYRPKTLDGYVFKDPSQKKQVEAWINDKMIPNLLFSGSAGIGKTTLAKLLIHQLDIDPYDLLVVNASRETGIDFLRDKVHPFSQTMPFGNFKVVMLDEADRISLQGQDALKAAMEEYTHSVRFILTTNHPHKIIPPLHSRCQGFHFEKTDHTEFTARAATILVNENIDFDLDVLDSFVKATYPDLRKCINLVQQHSVTSTLTLPDKNDKSTADWKLVAVELFKQHKLKEARQVVCTEAAEGDVDTLFRWAYDNLDIWSKTEEGQDEAILIIRKALVNSSLVADQEINMSACLVELTSIDK